MRLSIIIILLALPCWAVAQDSEDTMAEATTLQVAEIIFYSADVGKALEHYVGRLGWEVHFEAPGDLAILDVNGAYQVAIVAAKWTEGWEAGKPVPPPQLSFESKDLAADRELLLAAGADPSEIGGDEASMLMLTMPDPAGHQLFIWQDTVNTNATGVPHPESPPSDSPWNSGEALLFFNDMDVAETFYATTMGLTEHNRHGGVFVGLNRSGGRIVGLYDWPKWWEKPADGSDTGTMRLSLEARDIKALHNNLTEAEAGPGELIEESDGLKWFHIADPDGNLTLIWQFVPPAD